MSESERTLLFIGLNPSKANSCKDDATLRRLSSFCDFWGYGNLVVVNLFARISKSSLGLRNFNDPIGDLNDYHINFFIAKWSKIPNWDLWLGWGTRGSLRNRNNFAINLIEDYFHFRMDHFPKAMGPLVIGTTKEGHPLHPLYASKTVKLLPFE